MSRRLNCFIKTYRYGDYCNNNNIQYLTHLVQKFEMLTVLFSITIETEILDLFLCSNLFPYLFMQITHRNLFLSKQLQIFMQVLFEN